MSICSRSSTWLSLQRGTRPTRSVNGTQKPSPLCCLSAQKSQPLPPPAGPPPVCPASNQFPQILSPIQTPNSSYLRPFLAPPLQNQIEERSRPNLPSWAPDGVDVRVKLLHSRSQELEEPLGEEVAACGPRHGGSCPGHSGGTSSRHHELPLRPEPAARAAGN